jgi:hypothetical protein
MFVVCCCCCFPPQNHREGKNKKNEMSKTQAKTNNNIGRGARRRPYLGKTATGHIAKEVGPISLSWACGRLVAAPLSFLAFFIP